MLRKGKKKSVKEFQINALWRSLIKWNEVYKFSPFHVKKCYRNIISMTKKEQFTENMASITNSNWFAETFCQRKPNYNFTLNILKRHASEYLLFYFQKLNSSFYYPIPP